MLDESPHSTHRETSNRFLLVHMTATHHMWVEFLQFIPTVCTTGYIVLAVGSEETSEPIQIQLAGGLSL